MPLSAAHASHQSIPGSQLAVLDHRGHRPEVERPEEFVRLVHGFLAGRLV